MRLNRVLQMTAAIGITVAATIFTISCGEDGAEGNPGTGCTLKGSDVPYTVVCNGVEVGPFLGGADGDQPPPNTGNAGTNGKGCYGVKDGLTMTITCDGNGGSGVLNLCEATYSGRETIIQCGGNPPVGLCDAEVFNPSKKYCPIEITGGGPQDIDQKCGPEGTLYDAQKEYCGFEDESALEAGHPTVITLCSEKLPIAATARHKPNAADTTIAGTDTSWVLAAASAKNNAKGGPWKDEFCQAKRYVPDVQKAVFIDSLRKATSTLCGSRYEKLNEGEWKGEYCGWAGQNATTKSVLSDACGTGYGPHEIAYNVKYCSVKKKLDRFSDTTSTYCELSDGTKSKLNESTEGGIVELSAWKKEYCGYEDAAAATAKEPSKLIGNICDYESDTTTVADVGINAVVDANTGDTWLNEYCQAIPPYHKNAGKTMLVGIDTTSTGATIFARNITKYCLPGTDTLSASIVAKLQAATDAIQLNAGTWQSQYCGFASQSAFSAGTFSIKEDACSDGKGPNAAPTDSWKNEYCQLIDKTSNKTKRVGIDVGTGKGFIDNLGVYCVGDTSGTASTILQSASSEARINDGANEWKDQYCGYATQADFAAGIKKFTILEGKCDAGGAPNAATAATDTWKAQYCQAQTKGKNTTTLVGIPDTSGWNDATLFASLVKVYCLKDTADADRGDFGDTSGFHNAVRALYKALPTAIEENTINKGEWKDEYCGFEDKSAFNTLYDGSVIDLTADPKIQASTTNPRVGAFSVKTGTCDANSSSVLFSAGNFVGPNAATLTSWVNQYCTVADRTKPFTKSLSKSTSDAYCGVAEGADWRDASSANRLNEGTWKGEYCLSDNVIGVCKGGQEPIPNAKSTVTPYCR